MPIISRIGRDAPAVRLLVLGIYGLLLAGAITMVYPFLLMIAGSTKSGVDRAEMRPVPSYLTSDVALWRKHVEGLFNESLSTMQQTFHAPVSSFEALDPPKAPNRARADVWAEFLADANLPYYAYALGYLHTPQSKGTTPSTLRRLQGELIDRFGHDIREVNAALGTDFVGWNAFWVRPQHFLLRRELPQDTPLARLVRELKRELPPSVHYYFSPEGFYLYGFLKPQYTREIENYNREHGTTYASYEDLRLPRRVPDANAPAQSREDWIDFVRTILNLFWIRADDEAAPAYRAFLKAKYGEVATLNRNYRTEYASFDEVPLIDEPPAGGMALSDWSAFLEGWRDPDSEKLHILPAEHIRIHSVDFMFRDWLRARYGTVDAVNEALGTAYGAWTDVRPPQQEYHWFEFLGRRGELRKEFSVRNYLSVIDYMVLHGRGILNTAIYCALAVLAALLVNPLAAYALSRYKPPSSYKILLVLMLTMAFPPMVAQIPNFLMLRELGLLNTFAALILPGLANGYSIFLLKGFFDSQPQELYESAALDGAGEFRIFWQITMSLSKPILAVIALNAFKMAYSNFMFALLICQDKRMWTLMVWLYQLQRSSGMGVIYASLIIAAIPIFLMFVLCQNIIMRGIVVPVEK